MQKPGTHDYPSSPMQTRPSHLRLIQAKVASERPPAPGDAELVAALRRRDPSAAGALYDRLLPVVDAAIRRVCGNRPTDYDDLVQIAFEQILRSIMLDRYAQTCSLASWATLIASRIAITSLRAAIRERRVLDRATETREDLARGVESASLERSLEARSEISRLQQALTGIGSARREALVLHDVFGYGVAEVAELTGVGIRAAQSRLFRGRRDLLQRLAELDAREERS